MTMIEKVARAIAVSEGYFPEGWVNYEDAAKAAIEAMREPTDEMINAEDCLLGKVHWDYNCHVCGGAKFSWHTMVDAALEGK